ncbi:MAG TPA: CsiV family protein [Steroidobacter sp.]|jgi:hypothetical protein|nr:CsiV family protein [Steroidobacter sp.]
MDRILARARLLRGAALIVIFAATFSGAAAQTQPLQAYDVELVIFQHLSPGAAVEDWELEAAEAGKRLSIPDDEPTPLGSPAAPAPAAESNFPSLPAARYRLTAIEETLRRNHRYRPLAHFGWTQPGFARKDAKFVPISTLVPASSGLVGQIALSRGRYLHLTLDLLFQPPDEPRQRYALRQTRRMRSNERHYIDHPKFGVIAVITPARD